jgi:carbamoyltransferase
MSLGSCYEAVTEFCGFRPNYDEGKTMGLAPYGDPEVFRDRVERLMALDENGGIAVDLSYFEYQFGGSTRCGPRFYELFGAPRREGEPLEDRHRNAAAAFQAVLEDHALTMCRTLQKRTGCRHMVIAGGVALNSVMNGRILREANVDDVYVMPGAGDNGTSIGAAAVVYHRELGQPRGVVHDNPYLGTAYGEAEAAQAFRSAGVAAKRHDDVIALAAELLADGKIVGWFQGRMEFGPRALGNRSILANPTLADMKDTINARIKHREPFRPFAPSVVEERAEETFDIRVPAPFMLEVCSVRPDRRWSVPATTHVDGSARIHTVNRETNPKYHALITAFGKRSGVPVVLNTSLNDNGEPIAESPADAVRCFLGTGLDALIVGNEVAVKEGVRASS